jgi:hypothetical protein
LRTDTARESRRPPTGKEIEIPKGITVWNDRDAGEFSRVYTSRNRRTQICVGLHRRKSDSANLRRPILTAKTRSSHVSCFLAGNAIASLNDHRRHDTANERAMVGARMANLKKGGASGIHKTNSSMDELATAPLVSRKRASELSGAAEPDAITSRASSGA